MSLETWLGICEDPGVLEGYGPVAAQVARAIAREGGQGVQWRCVPVEGEHGAPLGLGVPLRTERYVPPVKLAELVRALEPLCAFPGCRARAWRCDLDHQEPYPGGATCSCNLTPLCRPHHNLKTSGGLTVEPSSDPADPPGTTIWTTRAGLSYRRRPTPALARAGDRAGPSGSAAGLPDNDLPLGRGDLGGDTWRATTTPTGPRAPRPAATRPPDLGSGSGSGSGERGSGERESGGRARVETRSHLPSRPTGRPPPADPESHPDPYAADPDPDPPF